MREVVLVDAVRTPFGRRGGGLARLHAIDLLGATQSALFTRTRIDPSRTGQVIGGCVGQVGMGAMNVTRTAWLAAGLPLCAAATTVDSNAGHPSRPPPSHGVSSPPACLTVQSPAVSRS